MSGFAVGFTQGFNIGMFSQAFGTFPMFTPFGFYGNPFACCCNRPLFFTPIMNFNNLGVYSKPMPNINLPTLSYDIPQKTMPQNLSLSDYYSTPNYSMDTFTRTTTNTTTTTFATKTSQEVIVKTPKSVKTTQRTPDDFETMLDFVLKAEGGYVEKDGNCATNKGIQQSTYDSYRARKGLDAKDVKDITDEEVRDIYYNDYYLASGADKIKDQRLALYVFDTAVNNGVSVAKKLLKQSGNNPAEFEKLRREKYVAIAQNPSKAGYLEGWKNRMDAMVVHANKEFV